MLTLRDLLTGAVPGNVLSNLPLGDASDPQFNRFTFNIGGNLGPNLGAGSNGVLDPRVPNIFAGPYGGQFGAMTQQPQPPPQPMRGTTGIGNPNPNLAASAANTPGFVTPFTDMPQWGTGGLKSKMLSWKGMTGSMGPSMNPWG